MMKSTKQLPEGFRGVWLPRELWDYEDLQHYERLILAIIISLDNENGCYATNAYLGRLLNRTPKRISTIINNLKSRDYITAIENKDIGNKRILLCNIKITKKQGYPIQKNIDTGIEKQGYPNPKKAEYYKKVNKNKNKKKEREPSRYEFLFKKSSNEIRMLKKRYRLPENEWKFFIDYFNTKDLGNKNSTVTTFERILRNWKKNHDKNYIDDLPPTHPSLRKITYDRKTN